eukprot:4098766-Heterocapsa_arctica.AAC.1
MTEDQRAELQHRNAYLVVRCFASGQREVVIERELNVLTLAEAKANLEACQKAMVEELRRWSGLSASKRMPKGSARNVLDS